MVNDRIAPSFKRILPRFQQSQFTAPSFKRILPRFQQSQFTDFSDAFQSISTSIST
jgi:hypothetical protein